MIDGGRIGKESETEWIGEKRCNERGGEERDYEIIAGGEGRKRKGGNAEAAVKEK